MQKCILYLFELRYLGNDKPKEIKIGNESSVLEYWIDGLPLKVITHGWLQSDENFDGVFAIKTGTWKQICTIISNAR